MMTKYTIDYAVDLRKSSLPARFTTDDPVACEEALEELLERNFAVKSIKHEGVELPRNEFDHMVRNAASLMASKKICASLGIKPEEEQFRFGFSA
ncbi:MAG TPA: hypothetical protein VI282_18320 [Verrucomicrobiae bacterium]|jgi:hypothetical protein